MSEEKFELVRAFYRAFDRWLASLSTDPEEKIEESAELEEMFDHLVPDAEWDWALSTDTFKGREQLLQAVADWYGTVDYWTVEIEKLTDCGGDRVLMDSRVVARGKGSGTPFEQHVHSVITICDGKLARFKDYTERADALEAVGLSE
jgi:ketosteroid isomerase-like protein